jgi:hypothetical protein
MVMQLLDIELGRKASKCKEVFSILRIKHCLSRSKRRISHAQDVIVATL